MNALSKNKPGTRTVIYTRVSTDEQAEKGYSLASQEETLRLECQKLGIEVAEHFQDDGYSAKNFKRPAFQRLLEYVKDKSNAIKYLYVVRWDRFSRNITESYGMIAKLALLGVEVKCLEEQLDANDPASVLIRAIKLAEPEMDNRRRALNTKMGMERAKAEGRYVCGKAPFGYSWVRDQKNRPMITPNLDAPLVLEAFITYASGLYSIDQVWKQLREQGLKISRSQFHTLLRNPTYAGKIRIKGDEEILIDGIHRAIVPLELYFQVQDMLGELNRKNKGHAQKKTDREELGLRRFLKCGQCGKTLTGSRSKGNGGTYFYYHCQDGCKVRFRADEANKALIDHLGTFTVPPEVSDLYIAIVEDTFKVKEGDRNEQVQKNHKKIEEFEGKLLKIDEMYLNGQLEADSYKRLKGRTSDDLNQCYRDIEQLLAMDTNFMKYCRYGMTLLSHLDIYYAEGSLEVKRKLIGSIFPEKLIFENGSYRTTELNPAIELIGQFQRDLGKEKAGQIFPKEKMSGDVPIPGQL